MSNSILLLRDNYKAKDITEKEDTWKSYSSLRDKYKPVDTQFGYRKYNSESSSKQTSSKSLSKFGRRNNSEKINTEQADLSLSTDGYVDSQSVLFIKEYFAYNPYERVKSSKTYARNIKSVDEVFAVLKLSKNREIKEGYDGAVALLAECQEKVLSETVDKIRTELIINSSAIKKYEDYLEILITAIACSGRVRTEKKLNLIQSLLVKNLTRIVKTAIIDAFTILEGEIDTELIKIYLERFTSQQEPDEYVRSYAEEAISDLD